MVSYTRTVDGLDVDEDRCRVSGQVHVEPNDAKELHVGSDVMVVMLARVQGPTFKEAKEGIVRVNVLKPLEFRSVSDPEFKEIVTTRLKFDEALVSAASEPELGYEEDREPEIVSDDEVLLGDSDEPVIVEYEVPPGYNPATDPSLAEEIYTPDLGMPQNDEDGEDDDTVLAEWLEYPRETGVPVGGGRYAQGEEAERLRRFLNE